MNSLGDPSRDNSVLLEQALYQPLCRLLDIKFNNNKLCRIQLKQIQSISPIQAQSLDKSSQIIKLQIQASSHTHSPLGKDMFFLKVEYSVQIHLLDCTDKTIAVEEEL